MKWNIITDSSCDYVVNEKIGGDIHYAKVPFIIRVGEKDYVDSEGLDVTEMIEEMESCPEASQTSCPAPGAWYELFEKADCTIAITISDKLSGSYNSAVLAKELILEQYPDKKIFVLDSRSAGSALSLYVQKTIGWIEDGYDFSDITEKLTEYSSHRRTIFVLTSFNNLIKNGRIKKVVGIIAGKLGISGMGVANEDGDIEVSDKIRGTKKVIAKFIADMKEHHFQGGKVIISHCNNMEFAEKLRKHIAELWADAKVEIIPMGGLCSYYAERSGIIVAY